MGHFYLPDGTVVDGLRAARKCNALPSPNTVLDLVSSYGLQVYRQRQMFEATATTHRAPSMTDDEYYAACEHWCEEHAKMARDKGTRFHDWVQEYLKSGSAEMPVELEEHCQLYKTWLSEHVEQYLLVEQVVVGEGYAGRLDLLARLKDGRCALIDAKTQNTKGRKFQPYARWAMQLGAYAGACDPRPDVLVSVMLSTDAPTRMEVHEWPKPPSYYHQLFRGLLAVWCEDNDYFPCGESIHA